MRIVTRLIAMNRGRQLGKQFREIERQIRALPKRSRARLGTMALREIGQASRSDFPHLYGTPPEERYLPWGQGTDIGLARARSDNAEVAMRGIALWLAVAYHETKNTPHPSIKPHHRDLMRLLRELKEDHRADPIREWTQAAAAA
ncbi:hypothetical protein SAMN04487785_103221 [Dyella jiangningensis]|uniref:hypothetical protein n=1 Tax=Dyella sp. AtDHG13 TaxID=1938897 RepID=UPI00088422F4|nr:hypothetical protein [Dyella sp. AtDHG13]PXV61619.1 hypothetical protein BDW41_101362 [Dyella sp. AtDHG13]SDJ69418.1 hypothetical protein SAMN04487785_103221 [Dyella jiangningensis]